MKKLFWGLLTGFALACVASASYAQHHSGEFHGPGAGFHASRFHNGGFHHSHDGRFLARLAFLVGVPFFRGAAFHPYAYNYPDYDDYASSYGPPQSAYWYYCPDQGYYPAIQTCLNGWLRVVSGLIRAIEA